MYYPSASLPHLYLKNHFPFSNTPIKFEFRLSYLYTFYWIHSTARNFSSGRIIKHIIYLVPHLLFKRLCFRLNTIRRITLSDLESRTNCSGSSTNGTEQRVCSILIALIYKRSCILFSFSY